MIYLVDKSKINDILELEKSFPQIFTDKSIANDFVVNPFTNYLVYKMDNKIVAFLNYTLMYDRIEIININVIEDYKRKGIASMLMDELLLIATNNKSINITLEVNINNICALNLYKKYGFKECALRKGYYDGVDALLMEKEMM